MRNPFKRPPPPPEFDPFEVEELIARATAKVAEMGLAEKRLNETIKRAKGAKAELEDVAAAAKRRSRTGW